MTDEERKNRRKEKNREYQRAYRRLHPDRVNEQRRAGYVRQDPVVRHANYLRYRAQQQGSYLDRYLRRKYNITEAEYRRIEAEQGLVCAICGGPPVGGFNGKLPPRFVVDHDHATGRVRGLLCNACNRGIGVFGDRPDLIGSALAYLVAADTVLSK